MTFDIEKIRRQFPALNQKIDGVQPVFFDGPGGTQVPQTVLAAMTGYLGQFNSNLTKSPFFAVQKTHDVVKEARLRAAIFVNAQPENIIFGPNMTTITAHLSRSIAREWKAGDEIIVTALDHFSNVSFWRQEAKDRGVTCHMAGVHKDDLSFDYEAFEKLLSKRTKLVAFTLASNVCGTRIDAKRIIKMAKSVGALTYVDSVHAAPHYLPDAVDLDCDFMACSAYKFFGPHYAFVYGKRAHLERLNPFKVEPAPETVPERWETGTKSFEALAGISACIEYLASLGEGKDLRARLASAYQGIQAHEKRWAENFLARVKGFNSLRVHGITDTASLALRSPTFAITIDGYDTLAVSTHLAEHQISTGAGTFYGVGVTDTLGLTDKGGVMRVGCVHYNTLAEIDRFFEVLEKL